MMVVNIDQLMARAAAKVEKFVRENPKFQATCNSTFRQLDWQGSGRVATADAVEAIGGFFEQLSESLAEFGLAVEQPSEPEVATLLVDAGLGNAPVLNRDQFDQLYIAVLKLAAGKCVKNFVQKYGAGIAAGTVGLFIVKRLIRSVPVVGAVASPLLVLVPTLIVGPVLGVAGVYARDHGGLGGLRDLWRNIRGRDGTFISG